MFRRHRWIPIALAATLCAAGSFAIFFLQAIGVLGPRPTDPWDVPPTPGAVALLEDLTVSTLVSFETQADFDDYVRDLTRAAELQYFEESRVRRETEYLMEAPEAAAEAMPDSAGEESITNTQEAGVDEGGIVKAHGEHLIVLRRGRLFSVHLGANGALTPVSRINAYPPGIEGGWYDEMLVAGDTIVVIGFNWATSGTEIGRFHIDDDGQLSRIDTNYLSSDDYYSSRNYASRLIGQSLIFYMPYSLLRSSHDDGEFSLDVNYPGTHPANEEAWNAILDGTQIIRPVQSTAAPVLHTVVTCDLSQPSFHCSARGILGPASRSFYVSRDAVYVWVSPDRWGAAAHEVGSVVYRLPLDESEPIGAARVAGSPIDQFAFREGEEHLNVLVRASGGGDAMWQSEEEAGSLALMRLPLSSFTDGVVQAPRNAFTPLPAATGGSLTVRHVGAHVLYGAAAPRWRRGSRARSLFVHSVTDGRTTEIELPHGVDRLDRLGTRGVAIGASEVGLQFTAIDLGQTPHVIGSYERSGAEETEGRSHGFFYKPSGPSGGTLGLPTRRSAGPRDEHDSAGVLFVDVQNGHTLEFTARGTLDASGRRTEDHCVVSCADWYGNARPIFYRGRVFALLGYELVEGRLGGDEIVEVSRTNLYEDLGRPPAPPAADAGLADGGVVP